MEEQIKQVVKRIKVTFVYFWLLPILLVILGESGGDWIGIYAGNVRVTYFAETITILLVATCVPLSLKLFSWILVRRIDTVAIQDALRLYSFWCRIRLALLAIPVLAGFFTYYMILSDTGHFVHSLL